MYKLLLNLVSLHLEVKACQSSLDFYTMSINRQIMIGHVCNNVNNNEIGLHRHKQYFDSNWLIHFTIVFEKSSQVTTEYNTCK